MKEIKTTVDETAYVGEKAIVYGNARVHGNARVYGKEKEEEEERISGFFEGFILYLGLLLFFLAYMGFFKVNQ